MVPSLESTAEDLEPLVLLKHDGHTKVMVPVVLKFSCAMDMKRYPFDDQQCELIFGKLLIVLKPTYLKYSHIMELPDRLYYLSFTECRTYYPIYS